MAWEFSTDPDYQVLLDWADAFAREKVEPLDLILGSPYDMQDTEARKLVKPLQAIVKQKGLWACHLGPELGGAGYGQVKLALLNEILGRSRFAPTVFGCQAPDSGNAEILAHFGTPEQKNRFLRPLLDGDITSCYSMTEPQAGADPTLFTTQARLDGGEWVLNGEKWFSSNARYASFFIVMAVTDPAVDPHHGMSLFLVPADTPGILIVRNVMIAGESDDDGAHAYVRYVDVRVPSDAVLGAVGQAFAVAQTRLGGGRIHHAMRTIALARKALDMMCERALSRQVRGGLLADLGVVQESIADSWIELEQFRLLVLRTAWLIDQHHDYKKVRRDVAAVKAAMPRVLHNIAQRAMHLHGALGISTEMPFAQMLLRSEALALADGPSEVHKVTVAKQTLRGSKPAASLFPSGHLPTLREQAESLLGQGALG